MRYIFIVFFFLQVFTGPAFSQVPIPALEKEQLLERLKEGGERWERGVVGEGLSEEGRKEGVAAEPAVKEGLPEEEKKKGIAVEPQVMQIKRLETEEPLYSFELRNAEIKDLLRILAHDYNLNILVEKNVKGEITASLTNISLDEALERIADMHNLTLEKKGNVVVVKPNLITKVFILKNVRAEELLKPPQEAGKAGEAGKEGEQKAGVVSGLSTIYDLLSEEGKILLGRQPNSIVVIDYPANVEKVEEFLRVADQKMASRVFKLRYLSVKELFPDLAEKERKERELFRKERGAERAEIKELKEIKEAGGKE